MLQNCSTLYHGHISLSGCMAESEAASLVKAMCALLDTLAV